MILGGGGSPNPGTEVLLELLAAMALLAWAWLPGAAWPSAAAPRNTGWLVLLCVVVILVPLVQLVPLPPQVWSGLPGRENEVASLSLVGEQTSWRPISLSPSRTLASLLAFVPPLFCFVAVARLDLLERRTVLAAIVAVGLASAILGAVQLTAGGAGVNLYSEHHIGWVTGFQANRNAEADVLQIAFLALSALAAPYLAGERKQLPLGLNVRSLALLCAGLGLVLLIATAMTGSRAGTGLVLVSVPFAAAILILSPLHARRAAGGRLLVLLVPVLLIVLLLAFWLLSGSTAMARVAMRFADLDTERADIWEDAVFALKQYWPFGFGMGGFEPAMFPAERLEVLTSKFPNRAHNDFLEIGIEAGLLGYAMVATAAATVLAMGIKAWRLEPRMRRQVVFAAGVFLLIALHSVVDYPLRSMAISCLAGVAAGMLLRAPLANNRPLQAGSSEMRKGPA